METDADLVLPGRGCRLRPLVVDDLEALVAIRRTPEVHARWRGEDLEREVAADLDDDDVCQLAIEDDDGRLVGMIQFAEEDDPDYRSASIDILVDPAHHRRGLASAAITALADHLCDGRGHHRLTIDPAADNHPAIACYRSVGFREVGVMRRYERRADGTWADGLLMEMLDDERPGDRRPRSRP